MSDESSDQLAVTAEQRQAAAGQFAHATEVVRTGGDPEYALQLLLSCCKLDPAHLMYRKALREVAREAAARRKGSWFGLGSLTNLPARGRLKAAKRSGDHRKVLECGEELLSRQPGDLGVQMDMAEAAEALKLIALAAWMLEEAGAKGDMTALQALAGLHERHGRLPQAIRVWEKIRQLDPYNADASTKIKDLAAADTIARSKNSRR